MSESYVYIMASRYKGTLYVGVTSYLVKRVWEHKQGVIEGFTKKYGVKNLVYYEIFEDIISAIRRAKELKGWLRIKKIALIESGNKDWKDLYEKIISS